MLLPHPSEPYGALSEMEDEAERRAEAGRGMCMAWLRRPSVPTSTREDGERQGESHENLCVVCYNRVSAS